MAEVIKKEEQSLKEVVKEEINKIFRYDIIKELFYAGIGCILFILLYSIFPKFFWEEIYRNIICAIIIKCSVGSPTIGIGSAQGADIRWIRPEDIVALSLVFTMVLNCIIICCIDLKGIINVPPSPLKIGATA